MMGVWGCDMAGTGFLKGGGKSVGKLRERRNGLFWGRVSVKNQCKEPDEEIVRFEEPIRSLL